MLGLPNTTVAKVLFRAVSWGALAGVGPVWFFSFPFSLLLPLHYTFFFNVYLFAISFVLVLAAAIFVLLPYSLLLRRRQAESKNAYVWFGSLAGILLTVAVFTLWSFPTGYVLAIPGYFAGSVTSHVWWEGIREQETPHL